MAGYLVTLVRVDRGAKTLRRLDAEDIDQAAADAIRHLERDGDGVRADRWFVAAVRQDDVDFHEIPFVATLNDGIAWSTS